MEKRGPWQTTGGECVYQDEHYLIRRFRFVLRRGSLEAIAGGIDSDQPPPGVLIILKAADLYPGGPETRENR